MTGTSWNLEFKDATSAAQAAAESAEMASIAARAAAELASRGNYSGDKGTGAYDSAEYSRENTPRKQQAEHIVKDEKTFHDQSSRVNDSRVMPSNSRNNFGGRETTHVDSQNISTDKAPYQQFHSYSPDSHRNVYEMPTEPPRAHSPDPHFDDLYERESDSGGSEVHPFDVPGENLQDTGPVGRNFEDVEIRRPSSDQESTDDYYGNFNSSHDTSARGSSTTAWDKQNDKAQDNSSPVVFDQYDSDVEEENLLDTFSSKHTEQLPGPRNHMGFSTADWSEQHKSESPSNQKTSALFSRTETQLSDNLGTNKSDIPSPHSYHNLHPAYDSDGGNSDEEIATTTHAVSLRSSHSGGSASSGLNKGSGPDGSPIYDYSGAQTVRNLNRVQSRDSDLSEEEIDLDKFKGSSSGENEQQSLPFAIRTSATYDDKEGDMGLNFGRLTPGLRNKPRQPPPYTKVSRERILPKQSTEESVDSEENTTFKQNRSSPKSSFSARTNSGKNSDSELYGRNQSVGTHWEAKSTVARNSSGLADSEKVSELPSNISLPTTKSSEHANSSQVLYHEKPGIGARRGARSTMARNYFDTDDSEEELEQQQTPQSKRSGVLIQSRRTREVTSDTKRDTIQTGAQYDGETESVPSKTQVRQVFNSSSTEQRTERRDASVYPRVAVQRSSPKAEQIESPMARGKPEEAEMRRTFVRGNEGDAETSAGTPKESTPKAPPAHVHPKLPTDYDSFAAHFRSLRTNRS